MRTKKSEQIKNLIISEFLFDKFSRELNSRLHKIGEKYDFYLYQLPDKNIDKITDLIFKNNPIFASFYINYDQSKLNFWDRRGIFIQFFNNERFEFIKIKHTFENEPPYFNKFKSEAEKLLNETTESIL